MEQPRCRAARRCGSQQSLGLLLSAPGPYGPVAGGGLHELQGCIRHGSPGALCASMRFNSGCTAGDAGQLGLGEFFDQWRRWLRCMGGREVLPAFIGFSLGLPGGDPEPGDKKEHAHIGRFVAGWRGRAQAHFSLGRPTLTAGILQGACAGRAAWECVV